MAIESEMADTKGSTATMLALHSYGQSIPLIFFRRTQKKMGKNFSKLVSPLLVKALKMLLYSFHQTSD
jgi:hypothetical protein